MTGLERNHRKTLQKKNQSLPTILETRKGVISDKNAIAEESNTCFTNIGPNQYLISIFLALILKQITTILP